jgi:hypothetical protein
MKSFFSSRHTRHTATVMLFVWLMALGIGIANACLPDAVHGHQSSAASLQATPHKDADHETLASDKAACLSFCAAEQTAAVKIKNLDAPSDLQTVFVVWQSAISITVIDPNDRPAPVASLSGHALPVSIRFLRLTI